MCITIAENENYKIVKATVMLANISILTKHLILNSSTMKMSSPCITITLQFTCLTYCCYFKV